MTTKSRERIYGAAIRASAEHARAARKEADKLACAAWNQRMLGYKGPRPNRLLRSTTRSTKGISPLRLALSDDKSGPPCFGCAAGRRAVRRRDTPKARAWERYTPAIVQMGPTLATGWRQPQPGSGLSHP